MVLETRLQIDFKIQCSKVRPRFEGRGITQRVRLQFVTDEDNFMSLERRGYVGFFLQPLTRERVEELAAYWLEKFGRSSKSRDLDAKR